MKVKKSSWRYRLIYDYSPFYPARSVCGYFWQVVAWVTTILITVPTLCLAVVSAPLLVFAGEPFKEWVDAMPVIPQIWFILASVIGVVMWGIAVVLGLVFVVGGICAYGVAPILNKVSDRFEEPGLFRQWIKAKKEKICPLIEYVDE